MRAGAPVGSVCADLAGKGVAVLRETEVPLDPDLPVLELSDVDAPVPHATAPLLVTAHGHPLGFVPADQADPRAWAQAAFGDRVRPAGSWQDALGDRRPAATVVI